MYALRTTTGRPYEQSPLSPCGRHPPFSKGGKMPNEIAGQARNDGMHMIISYNKPKQSIEDNHL